jgi:DNA-binding HxlR family transcriptional regulator
MTTSGGARTTGLRGDERGRTGGGRSQAPSRRQGGPAYNAFMAQCPSRLLLERISNKWVVLVLCALGGDSGAGPGAPGAGPGGSGAARGGSCAAPGGDSGASAGGASGPSGPVALRYSELARLLSGVSQKMLTQTLRSLERDGLLTRTVTPTVPVTVTYELTGLGLSLHRLMRDLREWAQDHMDEVLAHREKHAAQD